MAERGEERKKGEGSRERENIGKKRKKQTRERGESNRKKEKDETGKDANDWAGERRGGGCRGGVPP